MFITSFLRKPYFHNRLLDDKDLAKVEKQISIKKNYIYNLLYQLLTLIVPFITAPYTARIFGADGIGIQSYTNSILAYFTLFATLGTASYGQREIARNKDSRQRRSQLFWEIELLSMTTTGITILIWIILIMLSSQYTEYYLVLTISLIATAFDISWFFSGQEMFQYIVLRNSVFKIIGTVLLFTVVREKSDLLLYMALTASTGLLGNLSMWTYLPKFLQKMDFRSLNIFAHLKDTFTYFIPTIASSIYTVMDKTMIGLMTNEIENGYYEQATKIIRVGQTLLLSLNTVMTSRMSYLFAQGKTEEIKAKIFKSYDFILFMAIPMMFGVGGMARKFVPWFFGPGYKRTAVILCFLSPLPLVICISNVLGSQYLTPSGQRARSSKGIIIGACVNFLCNLVLIPELMAVGAAIASLIAEVVISFIYVRMSNGYITWHKLWRLSWKRFLSGGVMLIGLNVIGNRIDANVFTTFIQIICGGILYWFLLLGLRDSFCKKMVNNFWALIERRKMEG